jgi:hypothetical protein
VCRFPHGTGKLERQSARHASISRSRTMWFLRKKSDDQRRSVLVLTTGSPCRSPSVGDPRLAISVSISDVISDSLTNRSDPSSSRNLHPSRWPPAPNSNSYARIRLKSNGRLMCTVLQGGIASAKFRLDRASACLRSSRRVGRYRPRWRVKQGSRRYSDFDPGFHSWT